MLITLTGAIKNVGDYLIGARGRALLKAHVDTDLVNMSRFSLMREDIDKMNQARAVILCGGPALKDDIFPNVYPEFLAELKVPVVPLGLGWSGRPVGKPETFAFNDISKQILTQIHSKIPVSSCRDHLTHGILNRYSFNNLMTGCPAWYDLEVVDAGFTFNPDIKRLVFSTPATVTQESMQVMRLVAKRFPKADKICSFHRGILPDRYTHWRQSLRYSAMAAYAVAIGYKVVDTSYALEKIDFYKDCDLHIGYRVHAHILFLSRRKPSFLINEDGRGQGQAKSLGLPPLNAGDTAMLAQLEEGIDQYYASHGAAHTQAIDTMRSTYGTMREFLSTI